MRNSAIHITLLVIAASFTTGANAQESYHLQEEIRLQDSLLFDAFNRRDTAAFSKMLDADLEFYHDKDGLAGKERSMQSLHNLAAANNGLHRTLLAETLEVYPIPGYGAIQLATHCFCHPEGERMDCGDFKFVHIWRKDARGWKITRVISYAH